jgi:hypothetical protein
MFATLVGASRSDAAADPPQIIPWKSIGLARIGMTQEQLEAVYGASSRHAPYPLPAGTRYAKQRAWSETYPAHGGKLYVVFLEGRVATLATDSRYYTTPGGIRIGVRVAAKCKLYRTGGHTLCSYSWHGFSDYQECGWIAYAKGPRDGLQNEPDVRVLEMARLVWQPAARASWVRADASALPAGACGAPAA